MSTSKQENLVRWPNEDVGVVWIVGEDNILEACFESTFKLESTVRYVLKPLNVDRSGPLSGTLSEGHTSSKSLDSVFEKP
jgi:hypothetical protein